MPGTPDCETELCSIRIVAAPQNMPPFWVEATVVEQDTYRLLDPGTEIREPREGYRRLVREMAEAEPAEPGEVLVEGEYPVRLHAIVHDLEREPSWTEGWITIALEGIFRETERRGFRSVALPLLGTRHGSLPVPVFLGLLKSLLEQGTFTYLERIWLVLPPGGDCSVLCFLKADPQSI